MRPAAPACSGTNTVLLWEQADGDGAALSSIVTLSPRWRRSSLKAAGRSAGLRPVRDARRKRRACDLGGAGHLWPHCRTHPPFADRAGQTDAMQTPAIVRWPARLGPPVASAAARNANSENDRSRFFVKCVPAAGRPRRRPRCLVSRHAPCGIGIKVGERIGWRRTAGKTAANRPDRASRRGHRLSGSAWSRHQHRSLRGRVSRLRSSRVDFVTSGLSCGMATGARPRAVSVGVAPSRQCVGDGFHSFTPPHRRCLPCGVQRAHLASHNSCSGWRWSMRMR